ncbi:zinc finger and BTB domain-containing protein 5 [Grus japonensis]|uniref:Zinc finger and BTB domain-containing protein 5 n=1 Tax=Grus japonensis TaxID=30415 RepID=A0ABC9XAC3_GRUJA
MEKTMMKQVVPLQPMKDHIGADLHTAAHGGPYTTAGRCALKEAAAHGEPTQEQVFWQKVWPSADPCWSSPFLKGWLHSVERTHAGAVPEELQPMGKGPVSEGLYPMGWMGSMPEQMKSARKEWQRQGVMNQPQAPNSLGHSGGWNEVEELGMKE